MKVADAPDPLQGAPRRRLGRAWLVYGIGIAAYIIAVMQRTSIGVAGVAATERFEVNAAVLSSLAVLQLIVYAAMQIPVGVLMDRYGPRKLMITGTACMLVGQLAVAFSPDIGTAVVGRVLVGAGDATVFTSVIRLTSAWFDGPIIPQLSQWIGNLGQFGQILSAVPFAWLLHQSGWTFAFATAASCSLLAVIALIVVIQDGPPGANTETRATSMRDAIAQFRTAFAHPGTRLGFWAHYSTQSSGTVYNMMWGYPFMVYALGYAPETAASLLIVPVVAAFLIGPVLGVLSARYPFRRSNVILSIILALAVVWTITLAWPGVPPFWLIIVLLVTMGIGGPGSMIGFDYARMFNPAQRLGSANGIVNTGGFVASVLMLFLVGVVLDVHDSMTGDDGVSSLYSLDGFRIAFLVQYVVVGIGAFFFVRTRRTTRRNMAEHDGIAIGPLWVAVARHWHDRKHHHRRPSR